MAEKLKDHREIGRELELFNFSRKVPGTVYWWPRGAILFDLIVNYLNSQLNKQGYQQVKTPAIIDLSLLEKSGHYDNYRERLFFVGNEEEIKSKVRWGLKPMNCPGSILIFKEKPRSYKELPLKFSEIGTVYRYEQPGEVGGLFRTRALTIDDAHIYCTEDQIEEEIIKLIDFIYKTYKLFSFKDVRLELSTRPQKSIGTEGQWEKAEGGLKKSLADQNIPYKINKGEGAFYGPKIDFHIKDSRGRSWQMGTIQLDFATAERLEAAYIDQNGQKKNPVVIHRAILGSLERFIAVLLEHTRGRLPVWLAPEQVRVIPISEKNTSYGCKIFEILKEAGVRVDVDMSNQTLQKKILEAEKMKIPYLAVVGEREEKSGEVAVRRENKSENLKAEELIIRLQKESPKY